jgi:hypothetical protein
MRSFVTGPACRKARDINMRQFPAVKAFRNAGTEELNAIRHIFNIESMYYKLQGYFQAFDVKTRVFLIL